MSTSGGAVEFLLNNLIDLSKEEIKMIRDREKNAEELRESVENGLKHLNEAQRRATPNESVKSWLGELDDTVLEADNVLDELNYHRLSKKIKALRHHRKAKLPTCVPIINRYTRQRGLALRIKEMNDMFSSIDSRAADLGIYTELENAPALNRGRPGNIRNFLAHFSVGREVEEVKLVGILTNSTTEERMLSVFAIMGMGGIGKTAMADRIYHHNDIEFHYGESRIWVHVSQNFDPEAILKQILYQVAGVEVESMQDLLEELLKALKHMTYLLVLDDVWNQDPIKWEYLMNSLSEVTSTKGNVIIVTTRNEKVASIVSPLHILPLTGLSDQQCLSFIKANVFHDGDCPSELEPVLGYMARECCGLLLAARAISTSYKKLISMERDHLLTIDPPEIVLETLSLSLDNLPSHPLIKCFTYCSMFRKGHRILKQTIIELWMAEGFLQNDESDDMESVGNNFFKILLQNYLLLAEERDEFGNVESCVMHEFMHDLASSILGSSDVNRVRYLNHGDDDSSPIPDNVARGLRTVIIRGNITDHTFSSFKSLHVLTIDSDQVTRFPSSISKLIHLRKLNISKTRIKYLPDWISEFHYLQTLNASTDSLRVLPSTFKYLISLRHLYLPSSVKLPEIGRLINLRALKFRVGNQKGYRIEELGSLNNLRELHIPNVENVNNKVEAEKAKLFEKQNLSSLHLEWDVFREGGKINDTSVLEGLEPRSNLEKLRIRGFKGKAFASWALRMAVRDAPNGSWVGLDLLTEITLSKCTECEEIPVLGHLPSLKSLHLWALWSVKSIKSSFYGSNSGVIFPALERFLLSDMPELMQWEEGEFSDATQVKVFPRLQSLKIYHAKNLESLPSWLFSMAQILSELDIRHCPRLKRLPDGLQALSFLESMTIKGCHKLKSIANPSGRRSFTSLRNLEIRDCQELMAMAEYTRVPLLQKVCLAELKSLENLPWFIDCLAESHFLEEMTITGVPNFMSTSSLEIWPFIKLRKLEVDVSREGPINTSEATMKTVDGFLKGCCPSLGELTLTGLEIWESLPPSIGNLTTALYSLELENFGNEELPLWFGNLSSLTRLCLSSCAKLNRLPSKDVMQRLTKLQELHIRDCPELRIESERQKIFQVRNIYVNGHPI